MIQAPTELWIEISLHLPSEDKQNLSLTCKRFQDIVNQTITICWIIPKVIQESGFGQVQNVKNRILERGVVLTAIQPPLQYPIFGSFQSCRKPILESLSVYPPENPSPEPRPTLFIDLVQKFPKLRQIYISPLDDRATKAILTTIQYLKFSPQNNLSSLVLYECPFEQSPGLNHDWITAWSNPNVTALKLQSERTIQPRPETESIQGAWQHFPNLETLFLRNICLFSALESQKTAPQNPFIKTLRLNHLFISHPSDVRNFVECFPNIRKVYFEAQRYDNETLQEIIPDSAKCSALRSVIFSSCQLIGIHSSKVLSLFKKKGHPLEDCSFRDCYHNPCCPIANISYRRVK